MLSFFVKHIVLHTVNNSNDLWGIPRANSLRNWFICNYTVVCNVEATVFLPDCKRRTPARVLPRVHLYSWSAQLQHQRNQEAPEGSCRQVTQSGNGCLSVCEFSLQIAALTITGWVLHTYILRNFRFLFQASFFVRRPKPYLFKSDHTYPGANKTDVPVVILYAEIGTKRFTTFHKSLSAKAQDGTLTYVLRHYVAVGLKP